MNVIFLDHDGVICLSTEWGSRLKKRHKHKDVSNPVHLRFDNFNRKAIKVINEIIQETDAEIVISSDWRLHATLEEMGSYYEEQGIIKKPIGYTDVIGHASNYISAVNNRVSEIKKWLDDHPEVVNWVAVDDLDMVLRKVHGVEYGLTNFVHTTKQMEGIKQSGIKKKIIDFLTLNG